MGKIKQQAIAEQEEYDNTVAWMATHIDRLPSKSFDAIVSNPTLLRETVNGWVFWKNKRAPLPGKYYLPTRRGLRVAEKAAEKVNWPPYLATGSLAGLVAIMPPLIAGVWNGISALGVAVVFCTTVAFLLRLARG